MKTSASFARTGTLLSDRARLDEDHDSLARIDELLRLCPVLVEVAVQDCEEMLGPPVTTKDGRLARPLGGECVELHLGVADGKQAVEVALVDGLNHAPDDLDILLRHRPRSISRIRASASDRCSRRTALDETAWVRV